MNNIDIKNKATSFFHKLPAYLVFAVRYIVFIGRKFPLLAAGFLLFYAIFFYQLFLSQPSLKSQLPPPPQPYSSSTSSPSYNKPVVPTAPVIDVAQATAYKNGSIVTIKWTKPVEYPQIYSANGKLEASCQSQSCDINLSQQQIDRLEVKWQQQGQRFEKVFRF